MPDDLRFLVLESEPAPARQERRDSVGQTSGETYRDTLIALAPSSTADIVIAGDADAALPASSALDGYDAIFLTGSPLHLFEGTPETRRQVELMRAVFASGTPAFGSCAGLQVATVAAGGSVRPAARGREAAFARRITPTEAGGTHPLLSGRPAAYDAIAVHGDEVESLPQNAILLARNRVTEVQAVEIRHGQGTFWGVQYHPELSLGEIAASLRRQTDELLDEGFAASREELEDHVLAIEALDREPDRRDLAWRLGLDEEVTDPARRVRELRNFIEHLVRPTRSGRGRG